MFGLTLGNRYYSANVLPLDRNYRIDEGALRELLQYFLEPRFMERGGLIANAEAGEIYYLSREEKRRVVEITMEEAAGRVPVLAGVFDLTTEGCLDVARDAKALGVDGLFVMPPAGCADLVVSWNAEKYPEYWLDQLKAIDAAVDLPMIAHPVGSPTKEWGMGLPGPTARLICEEVPNMIGWKFIYNYEGIRRMWKILRGLDRPVSVMCAGGRYFHEFLAHDQMDGTVSGSWNYGLEPMLDHIDAWKAGDVKKAREIWDEGGLGALHDYIYGDYSRLHLRYKIAAWLRGLIPSWQTRPPMPAPRQDEIETIYALLEQCGVSVIDRSEISRAA